MPIWAGSQRNGPPHSLKNTSQRRPSHARGGVAVVSYRLEQLEVRLDRADVPLRERLARVEQRLPLVDGVNEIANNAVTGALVGRTRGYNGEGNAAPRRRSSIDAGLARPNQLGESLSQLVQAADDAEGVPY